MKKKLPQKKWTFVGAISILAALLTLLWQSPAPAQFGLSDFRLNQLSSEVAALRLQVSQLQAQIGGSVSRAPVTSAPRIAPPSQAQTNSAQFDRLATLVIELGEQVRAIDDRLKAVEARFPQASPQPVPPASSR
ncbi:hypothetical protein NDI45_02615 [Leptolyngbya sp. GB1-A1]|uniref:hypothetical protein n=1 Tax=Leptolyngbya sp. GB1-A1 TaxID=2933908 RepID=UPI0032983CF2